MYDHVCVCAQQALLCFTQSTSISVIHVTAGNENGACQVKHAAASCQPSIVVALQRASHVRPIHYRQEALDEEAARVAFAQASTFISLCVCVAKYG